MGARTGSSDGTSVIPRKGARVVCFGVARLTLYTVRWVAFAVLSTLQPVVRFTLSLLAIGGFATCLLFRFVAHAPHFPFGVMLLLSVGMAVLSVVYALVVQILAP